jgi:hypothetical protein
MSTGAARFVKAIGVPLRPLDVGPLTGVAARQSAHCGNVDEVVRVPGSRPPA